MTVLLYLNFEIKPIQSAQHEHSYTVHKPFTPRTASTLNKLSEKNLLNLKPIKTNTYISMQNTHSAESHNDFMGLPVFLKKKKLRSS